MNYYRVTKIVNNIKLFMGKYLDKYNTFKVDYFLFCIMGTNIIIIWHTNNMYSYTKIIKKIYGKYKLQIN